MFCGTRELSCLPEYRYRGQKAEKFRSLRIMSIDFSQKERAFVDELAGDTGRDLDGWMSAIRDAGLTHRNEIIDWLRLKGFTFARASWLERIHHNGGKLIYAPADTRSAAELHKRKAAPPRPAVESRPPGAKPAAVVGVVRAVSPPTRDDGDIDALLAAAKAYRPLAQLVLRDILAAVPGADVRAASGTIVISHTRAFAALLPGPKDVRLLLDMGARPVGKDWIRAKLPAGLESLAALSHMLVLTDARQVTRELRDLIASRAQDTAG
jgi:hypothetical protein